MNEAKLGNTFSELKLKPNDNILKAEVVLLL